MGQKQSKGNRLPEDEICVIHKHRKNFKFWKSSTWINHTLPDENNNTISVTVLHRKVTPPETNKSSTPFSFIQCAISRLFTYIPSRKQKSLPFTPNVLHKNIIRTNNSSSSGILRGTSITRSACSNSNRDFLRKSNVFARPITPELVNVQHMTISPTVFPVITTQPKPKVSFPVNKSEISASKSISQTLNTTATSHSPSTIKSAHSETVQSTPIGGPSDYSSNSDSKNRKKREPFQKGCCTGRIAPPAYLDYSSPSYSNQRYGGGGGRGTGNPIIDRLKNVDVVEELQYYVPGENAGDNNETNPENDCEYFYVCNDCGEMEPCTAPKEDKSESKTGKPVTYSRRQRFNFLTKNRGVVDDNSDDDGPPFKWPGDSGCCCCPCCIAGLRRNPNCECKCCQDKGKLRVVNSFDEIPVGKNPEPKPKKLCICEDEEKAEECDELMPKESGVYFYDAEQKRFIKQVPRTPTPLIVERPNPPQLDIPQAQQLENLRCPDMMDVIQCLPPRAKRQQIQIPSPEPIVLPPICGGGMNDMRAILANVELAMRGGLNQFSGNCGVSQFTETTTAQKTDESYNSSNQQQSTTDRSYNSSNQQQSTTDRSYNSSNQQQSTTDKSYKNET